MDKAQFEREKQRGAAFAIASRLFLRKLITEDEYRKISDLLIQKYRPVVSSQQRFSGNHPIPHKSNRADQSGKEVFNRP